MTASAELDRLVHRVLLPGFVGTSAPGWVLRRAERGLGGVVLFSRNVVDAAQVSALTASLRAARPDLLVSVDEEGGDVTRLESAEGSSYAGAAVLGAADDPDLTRATAAGIGALLSGCGVDWTLAPDADVNSNPDNPVIGVRSFGPQPDLVSRHVAAAVHGFQDDAGILACAKHFPGHGDTSVDSHVGLPVVGAPADELRRTHLAPFRAAIEAGVATVMTAHLRVTALDPDTPATLSAPIVTGLLRGELGFDGLVVSDALEMAGVAAYCGLEEGAVRALIAGVDALCLGGELADEEVVERTADRIVGAVVSGRLPAARLVEAAARVDALVARRGEAASGLVEAGRAASRRAAEAALRVEGDVRVVGVPTVLTLRPVAMVAVGAVPWGLGSLLAQAVPGTRAVDLGADDDVAAAVAAAAGGPVVVVARDPHRHAWQTAALDRILAARPDSVVVEMGLPSGLPLRSRGRIDTRGASAVSAAAAVRRLLGET